MALSLGEDRGQESYPFGCISRGGDRARRLRFEDGDGVNRAATAAADLRPGAAAGALCGAGPDTKVRLEEEGRAQGEAACAAAQDDDHHYNDDDGSGPGPVNRRLGV